MDEAVVGDEQTVNALLFALRFVHYGYTSFSPILVDLERETLLCCRRISDTLLRQTAIYAKKMINILFRSRWQRVHGYF